MITDDGREVVHDIQQSEAGGGEDDYAKPFGVPDEDRVERLGFKDRVVIRPSRYQRLERWLRLHLYRPWK